MGRWNHGKRPSGDCDHQVSDVFVIEIWHQERGVQFGINTWRYYASQGKDLISDCSVIIYEIIVFRLHNFDLKHSV